MRGQPSHIRSDIAWSDTQKVMIRGQDLCEDLLGRVSFGDFAFLELVHRTPEPHESVLFNAVLVSLAEHGITPSSLTARLTLLGAPESLQGAVAAGLLGLGTTFVGTIEGAAKMIQEPDRAPGWRTDPDTLEAYAAQIAAGFIDHHLPVPGIGHAIHRPVDPRAERLFQIAHEQGFDDANERLMRAIGRAAEQRLHKELPVNVTGAIGAIASQLGVPWRVTRGLGVIARTVGLLGHILEELEQPIASAVWQQTEQQASAHLIAPTHTEATIKEH